jgi:hypothetical protein
MAKKRNRPPGILDILISALADPRGTMRHLLVASKSPPHLITSLFFLGCIVVAPPILYSPDGTIETTHVNLLVATLLTALLTLVLAGFFQSMATRALGAQQSIFSLFCAMTYSLTPFVTVMTFFYVATYWAQGHISVLQFLTTGFASQHDMLVQFFPTMVKLTCVACFILFANGIRALMSSSLSSAALIAAICVPLLMGSFVVALSIEELMLPGVSSKVVDFFATFLGYHQGILN